MPMDTDAQTVDAPLAALKVLAEPSRWKIVQALAREELCVCHLEDELGAAQPLVSHHLKVLRDAGLVEAEPFRQWTYYRLTPGTLRALADELVGMAAATGKPGERRRPCC